MRNWFKRWTQAKVNARDVVFASKRYAGIEAEIEELKTYLGARIYEHVLVVEQQIKTLRKAQEELTV